MSSERPSPADLREGSPIFATTHWTTVLSAKEGPSNDADEALSRLCQAYWTPLYAYLRRDGISPHDAEDLVQAFFERFVEKNFLRTVDRERGRFRSFLLVALKHFVANQRKAATREKRGGQYRLVSINAPDEEQDHALEMAAAPTPDAAYDRRWARAVMQAAADRLRAEYAKSGKAEYFDSLKLWLAIEPGDADYSRLGTRWNQTPGALAVAVHRLRARFRELIRNEVAQTVLEPADVDDEMSHLLAIMTRS